MTADAKMDRRRWIILALVFTAIMLNYVDRQIIALLKPTLQQEFSWTDRDYGHMTSAFQFAAAIAFLFTGWFIDKVGIRAGFAIGVGVWSLAGIGHAFASTVTQFITARAVLGAAESVGTPAAVKTAATYFPARERATALGLGNTAPNIGAVLTPLLVPPFAIIFGWQAAFIVAGALGLVWVVAWLALDVKPEAVEDEFEESTKGWSSLLTQRRTWAIAIAKMLTDAVWWFLLFWLPDLFHKVFGLSQGTVGLPVALVYAMAAMGAISGGWLPGKLMDRGWSVDRSRKTALLVYAIIVLPVPLVLGVSGPWTAAFLIGLALFAHQGFSTNIFALTADLFPARLVGSAIGLGAFAGNLAGMGMSEFAGWSLDNGHGYAPMFIYAAGAYLAAWLAIKVLVPNLGTRTVV